MNSSRCVKNLLAVVASVSCFLVAGCGNPSAMNASSANVKHITQGEFAGEVTHSTNGGGGFLCDVVRAVPDALADAGQIGWRLRRQDQVRQNQRG
jgi:hypothetical protein